MSNFGIFKGFSDKLFEGELPTNLGTIGSVVIPVALLDLYPNAAAAYSLRKLRDLYTGSAIRIRRSSDNTEQDIGFDILGNLNTSALTTFCGSGNGFVTTWYDQSGNGLDVTQTTAANQPQIVSSGNLLLQNTKPTIQFDGINDNLGTTFNTQPAFPITLITINKTSGLTDAGIVGFGNVGASRQEFWQEVTTLGKLKFGYYADDLPNGFPTGSFANTHLLYSSIVTSTFVQNGFGNGTSVGTYNGGGQYVGNKVFNIGKGRQDNLGKFINGNIQEIVIYLSDQTTTLTAIESNINSYYTIY